MLELDQVPPLVLQLDPSPVPADHGHFVSDTHMSVIRWQGLARLAATSEDSRDWQLTH